MSKTKALTPIQVPSEHRAAHVAGLLVDGRTFRLCFWTDEEWKALPAGEYVSMNITSLSGFGKVSVDLIEGDEWMNTLQEGAGGPLLFPHARLLNDICLANGQEKAAELLTRVLEFGVDRSIDLIKSHLADRNDDEAYWKAAFKSDYERREEERAEDPIGFRVTEEDVEQHYIARRGITADDVVAEQLTDITNAMPCKFRDQAIWQGNKLIAVISHSPNGQPVATRFDQPAEPSPAPSASAFDLGELGIEVPSAEVALLNAQPTAPRAKAEQAKAETKPRGKVKGPRR